MAPVRKRVKRDYTPIELNSCSDIKSPGRIADTIRRQRVIDLNEQYAGKLPRRKLFEVAGVSYSTGYRILKSQEPRAHRNLYRRGRKSLLNHQERTALETVIDANFALSSQPYSAAPAQLLGLQGTEQAFRNNMRAHGVDSYIAAQRKPLNTSQRDQRLRRATELDNEACKLGRTSEMQMPYYYKFRYTDEVHFALQRRRKAHIHRRKGHRFDSNKIQYKSKRPINCLHAASVIGYNYKGPLHFYNGSGKGGALLQSDYLLHLGIFKDAGAFDGDIVYIEDNDGSHGTRGQRDNIIKDWKSEHKIVWQPNPGNSPDLNPIEYIWRTLKQRLKSRGVFWDRIELQAAIEKEWDNLTIEEINKAIQDMPRRVAAVIKAKGGATAW